MLFVKKKCFSVTEKQIKKDFPASDGRIALKLNLRYPCLNCPKGDPLLRNAEPFYPLIAEGLCDFAEKELLPVAIKAMEGESEFSPYSVVMTWNKTFENEKYLSVMLEISVCNGENPPQLQRKTQIWERKFGTKCKFSEFFSREYGKRILKEYIGEENERLFDRQLFVMTESGFDFYLPKDNGYISVSLPRESA